MLSDVEKNLTTITGLIIPAAWDRDGNVTGVAISTHDEDEYLVQERAKGAEMLRLVRRDVEVTGWTELAQGKKTITVKNYRIRQRHV